MSSDWTLRFYRDGDEQGMLDLLTTAFGTWPAVDIDVPPIDHLRWKLNSDPLAKQFHYVADAGGRIIGCEPVVVRRALVGGRVLVAGNFADLAVHPDYRGQGVMGSMYSFDTSAFASAFDMVAGVSDSDDVHQFWKEHTPNRPLGNEIDILALELGAEPPVVATHPSVRSHTKFDAAVDDLWERAAGQFDFAFERRSRYLNWRYADPRAGSFALRVVERNGGWLGYSTLTVCRGKGFIADLLVLPGDNQTLSTLVADALRHFASSGISSVRTWCARRHPYRETFLAHGFQPQRRVSLIFRPYRDVDLSLLDRPDSAVHVMPGDTDTV